MSAHDSVFSERIYWSISDQRAHPSSPEEITYEFMAICPLLFIYTHESCFH